MPCWNFLLVLHAWHAGSASVVTPGALAPQDVGETDNAGRRERIKARRALLAAARQRSWPLAGSGRNSLPSRLPLDDLSDNTCRSDTPGQGICAFHLKLGVPAIDHGCLADRQEPAEGHTRCRMRVAYDGTGYHAWERFHGLPALTVARVLDSAISLIVGNNTYVRGASRTDAGVHARGQVAHFDVPQDVLQKFGTDWAGRFANKLNRLLPSDISVSELEPVDASFHAVTSSTGKSYVYKLDLATGAPDPMERWCRTRLPPHVAAEIGGNVGKLRAALAIFEGQHDFRRFSKRNRQRPRQTTTRTIRRLELFDEGAGKVKIEFDVDGALYRMLRCVVGAALAVAAGRLCGNTVREALVGGDDVPHLPICEAAPAHGLCLEQVHYAPQEQA